PSPWKQSPDAAGPTVIVDIDGVLASMARYEHLISAPRAAEKDWKAFHGNFGKAKVITSGRKLVESLESAGVTIVYSTTRPEQFARATWNWLRKNNFPAGHVMFRHFVKDGPRPATEVKLRHWWRWYDKFDDRNELVAWFDDNQPAINELRKQGCPAWHPKEFVRAVRSHSDSDNAVRAALEAGPTDLIELADTADTAWPAWKASEYAYQEKRSAWFARHQQRMRNRR
ncbi:MAG: hypothetical protein L0H59_13255, partial [Tomitella sp.]|nr:hypothetical protein [Tomitella sp.]